ncbi:hypothetical protein [Actinophytocola algeriensis]|uniref:Uncharacterized protein n=1 Tax=Actinophytocola algeriensis TaxID=1768010 RepID=A0A7W7QBD8_9PSEU|nr:hypothetical protein [Actinophytocola algeriensis]MBB4910536.1 hypothetical protein [Actinophytocola algeriensis]MBE1480475.1 hypothetical protein [Actinophytocola algeriensis]
MRRIPAIIAAAMILLVGLIGIAISIMDLFGVNYRAVFNKSPDDVALLILALIATSLGVEYLAVRWRQTESLRQVAHNLESIEQRLSQSSPVRRLDGASAIYADGTRLVNSTTRRIRSVIVGEPNKAPMSFSQTVARRLRELNEAGAPARFDAVIVFNKDNFDIASLKRNTAEKLDAYATAGLSELVTLKAIGQETPLGFDILIIDQKHVHIAFPSMRGAHGLMAGLVFEDQPEVAQEFANWFDERVWPNGTLVV